MIQSGFEILGREFPKALIETLQMVAISMAVSAVFGLLLGFVLFLTSSPLFFRNRFVNAVSGAVVNVIRSIPFVILMVFCLPLAKALVGTKIGPLAASVPLSIAAVAFQARLVEGALREVDQGVLEAAAGSGAGFWLIVRRVLLTEAAPGLVRAVTVTFVSLISYSAMAGLVGGGGIGNLAIQYGYYRFETGVMVLTVLVLIAAVQLGQAFGDRLAAALDRR